MSQVVAQYQGFVEDATKVMGEVRPERVLCIGEVIPDGHSVGAETRHVRDQSCQLPSGLWTLHTSHGTVLMVVEEGTDSGDPFEVRAEDVHDDHPVMAVLAWMDHYWDEATPVPRPHFKLGDEVQVAPDGRDGVVRSRDFFSVGGWRYSVRVDDRTVTHPQNRLSRPERDDDPQQWVTRTPATARELASTLTQKKLDANLSSTIFSYRASRTIFRPYQFKPVLKMLESGTDRLLIADEVGLGKTIEAGLLWLELEARGRADRVLVLCPSALVEKWHSEMLERFGFDLTRLDRAGLDKMLKQFESGRLPARGAYIASQQTMRGWDGLQRATELGFTLDLAIVDEAHALRNAGTQTHALGEVVSQWAGFLVFLSATPLNLGQKDLFNLLELLKPGEFLNEAILRERLLSNVGLQRIAASVRHNRATNSQRRAWLAESVTAGFGASLTGRAEYRELERLLDRPELTPRQAAEVRRAVDGLHGLSGVLTRTKKADVQEEKPIRQPLSIKVRLTAAEEAFYTAYYEWCVERARLVHSTERFAMQMPLRIAGSCLPAARRDVLEWSRDETLDDLDDLDGGQSRRRKPPIIQPDLELIRLAKALGETDSKFDGFVKALDELRSEGRQVLVFSFARQTIAYLEARLRRLGHRVATLHGGVSGQDRHRIMADFRAGAFDVVLASRVASEGLDFEFCSAVINYDIPWNPMEVEQRIGRVDRIGQKSSKIIAAYFHVPGTIESDILVRVLERIKIFEESIGELEPIISEQLEGLRDVAFDFELSRREKLQKADQIAVAVAEREIARDDIEAAAAQLFSSDNALIEGLADELEGSGRYLGQQELAIFVSEWLVQAGGEVRSRSDRSMTLRGSGTAADQVRALVGKRIRNRGELSDLSTHLAYEMDLMLSLDPEWSRTGGPPLLTVTHPLVQAAKARPAHRQQRFGVVRIRRARDVEPGTYVVLLSEAVWYGHRPSHEIWSECVSLASGRSVSTGVSDALWADVAAARLEEPTRELDAPDGDSLRRAVSLAVRRIHQRADREEKDRTADNDAFHEARKLSLESEHRGKVDLIRRRIQTLRARDKTGMIPLQEAQLRNAHCRHEEVLAELDKERHCRLDLSHVAVCVVEVAP